MLRPGRSFESVYKYMVDVAEKLLENCFPAFKGIKYRGLGRNETPGCVFKVAASARITED